MKFIRRIRGINQPNKNNALVLVWLLYFGCGMFEGERERWKIVVGFPETMPNPNTIWNEQWFRPTNDNHKEWKTVVKNWQKPKQYEQAHCTHNAQIHALNLKSDRLNE